jgi:predicted RND superfamily exporter protein
MKTLITIISFLFWTTLLQAQKVRLEVDNSKYLCLNDSISESFLLKLKTLKVDSTITILYDYDNGRLPSSIRVIIWTHNGISNIRFVQGCDKITKDTTFSSNLIELWDYINGTHFDDVSVAIKSGTGQSHDKFYHITVATPAKTFFVVVRDNERRKSEKYKNPETDTRVMLTNKIHQLLN